jgi:hypothetical protein
LCDTVLALYEDIDIVMERVRWEMRVSHTVVSMTEERREREGTERRERATAHLSPTKKTLITERLFFSYLMKSLMSFFSSSSSSSSSVSGSLPNMIRQG